VTALLEALLGRLPVGWLQLVHNPARMAAALAGVVFANVLVFMQLGFLGALTETVRLPYEAFDADLLISASDANTLTDGSPLPRQRLFQALAVSGVAAAVPLWLGKIDWKQPDGTVRTLDVLGIDPSASTLRLPDVDAGRPDLTIADRALLDRGTRGVDPTVFADIDAGTPMAFEAKGRTLTVTRTFRLGGGFSADGYLVVSDQTFLRLFPTRAAGAPSHVLVRLAPGTDRTDLRRRLAAALPETDAKVRTLAEAADADVAFQTTQRPVGLVFGFGIVIGVLVGTIIVYQVLSTDVADHLSEYATLKAIGYGQRFFLGIVIEEALVLAVLGFLPGLAITLGLYAAVAAATGLPVAMTAPRPVLVLAGTIALAMLSGALATRRLARADPADLF
jgi:putative ABC transport system permease protein